MIFSASVIVFIKLEAKLFEISVFLTSILDSKQNFKLQYRINKLVIELIN